MTYSTRHRGGRLRRCRSGVRYSLLTRRYQIKRVIARQSACPRHGLSVVAHKIGTVSDPEKAQLTETEIRTRYITPALSTAGWPLTSLREEYYYYYSSSSSPAFAALAAAMILSACCWGTKS